MDQKAFRDLIKSAKHGDAHAFGLIYSELKTGLYRFALYTLKNPDDAEDAVQSASIAAFRKIGTLKKDESLKSWYFKILYNECIKILTDKSRIYELPAEDLSFYEKELPEAERKIDIPELLGQFSEQDRSIIILSVLEDYSSKEIADILGMKPATVRSKLSRLLSRLRKQLEGDEDE